jgi:glutamine amidotransferase
MCRHLAYLGPPRSLHELLLAAPFSLERQSYQPRFQRHGVVNADGFGAGWFVDGHAEPVQYRRAQPIWTDRSFASLAPTVQTGCLVGAVRSATQPQPVEESGAAPFLITGPAGPVLFSHNGAVDAGKVWAHLPTGAQPDARMDSALLALLLADQLSRGLLLGPALAQVVLTVGDGRLNLLAADGASIAATTYGDTLSVGTRHGGVVVASEPDDDDAEWNEVPERHLVTVRSDSTGPVIEMTGLDD